MSTGDDEEIQEFIRRRMRSDLEIIQQKNPGYSLRAFAKKLEIQASNLSAFLNGKRNLSKASLETVTRTIFTNPEERKYILARINESSAQVRRSEKELLTVLADTSSLTEDEFLQLGDWYFYAIRTFLSLKKGPRTLEGLAEVLKLPLTRLEQALETLLRLGLITKAGNGTFHRTHKHIATPDSEKLSPKTHELKKRIHQQHIERALNSLMKDDPTIRDITWVNIPSDPKKLPQAREIIRKFQDDMILLLESEETSVPYRLTVQLVPVVSP
jgi:uncharacterized protein (TIGR02147 family)